MNKATLTLYGDLIPDALRRECADYAMAFGCPLCGCDITELSKYTTHDKEHLLLGLRSGVEVIQLTNGEFRDRFVAVCGRCYQTLKTPESRERLTRAINS